MNELELILTDTFRCSRADLYLNSPSILLKDKDWKRLDRIFKNRSREVPLQYILGYTEFMGLRFKVRRGVLIPRPETEILVEAAIEKIQERKNRKQKTRILDIGTGSGCIAISLAKFLQDIDTDIVAIDISVQAIKLAGENAKLHKVEDKVSFLEADIFSLIKDKMKKNDSVLESKFDIIACNPPYVSTSEIGIFDKDTLSEPRLALDGGSDGLGFYRNINRDIGKLIKKDGFLIMEIGYNQINQIQKIFSCGWIIEEVRKDYQGIERICIIRQRANG